MPALIAPAMSRDTLPAGSPIVKEGDEGASLFFLATGNANHASVVATF